jgi:hypothetical protein
LQDLLRNALICLDTVRRLALHNDQLLSYTLEKDGYPNPGRGNYALGLIIAEFFGTQKKALLYRMWQRLFYFKMKESLENIFLIHIKVINMPLDLKPQEVCFSQDFHYKQ